MITRRRSRDVVERNMSGGNIIELLCYLSKQVRNAAAVGNVNSDFVTWRVHASKPFGDNDNFGALSHSLGLNMLCEICNYAEGIVGDVIDPRKTPAELAFHHHHAVLLRPKATGQRRGGSPASGGLSSTKVGSVTFSHNEESVLQKLRDATRTSLTPDQPCTICGRIADDPVSGKASSVRGGRTNSLVPGGSAPSPSSNNGFRDPQATSTLLTRLTSEVGVQCGSANRFGEPMMPVRFGSAARMRELSDRYSGTGAEVEEFPAPATLGGPNSMHFDQGIADLKAERDRYKSEKDQLATLLREEQRKFQELYRERQEHRCDRSEKVQNYVQEIERLQSNLRDLMRGRDEVYSLLHQRRTAAAPVLRDAPMPYAPFRLGAPNFSATIPNPHDLLATNSATVPRSPLTREDAEKSVPRIAIAGSSDADSADVVVARRPSGPVALGASASQALLDPMSPLIGPTGHLDQPAGHVLLQMFSSVGDPYHVKRLIASHLRRGKNLLVLSSLDNVITDEIDVESISAVRPLGEGGIALTTNVSDWVLFMNRRERQQWLSWLYVLNPWLSTKPNSTIPINF